MKRVFFLHKILVKLNSDKSTGDEKEEISTQEHKMLFQLRFLY